MDCPAHSLKGAAAADMTGHFRVDLCIELGIAEIRFVPNECRCFHDHSGLAVTTLRNVLFEPSPLAGMTSVSRKTLDGCIPFGGRRRERYLARTSRASILMHGTSAAHAHAATVFRPGEVEKVTQSPKQGHIRRGIDVMLRSIDD